jgi:hypothetical protein
MCTYWLCCVRLGFLFPSFLLTKHNLSERDTFAEGCRLFIQDVFLLRAVADTGSWAWTRGSSPYGAHGPRPHGAHGSRGAGPGSERIPFRTVWPFWAWKSAMAPMAVFIAIPHRHYSIFQIPYFQNQKMVTPRCSHINQHGAPPNRSGTIFTVGSWSVFRVYKSILFVIKELDSQNFCQIT